MRLLSQIITSFLIFKKSEEFCEEQIKFSVNMNKTESWEIYRVRVCACVCDL